jgi:Putative Actinobacterial Holin-X, holin superfamily III
MPARETESRGLGAAARLVGERISSIVRLELELAALEVSRKIRSLGLGIGLAVGALIALFFMVGFAYAAVAAALTTVMPTWAALLVVTGILFFQTALLAILAVGRIKKGTPPIPEQAIREARLTTEVLKSDGR